MGTARHREGHRESRRCSRDSYQELHITKHTSIRRSMRYITMENRRLPYHNLVCVNYSLIRRDVATALEEAAVMRREIAPLQESPSR